jgi:hypothetical protein
VVQALGLDKRGRLGRRRPRSHELERCRWRV